MNREEIPQKWVDIHRNTSHRGIKILLTRFIELQKSFDEDWDIPRRQLTDKIDFFVRKNLVNKKTKYKTWSQKKRNAIDMLKETEQVLTDYQLDMKSRKNEIVSIRKQISELPNMYEDPPERLEFDDEKVATDWVSELVKKLEEE
jgi:hypothetical protein